MERIKFIKLTQGQFAIVDEFMFEELNKYHWQALKDGRTWYAKRSLRLPHKRTLMLMHRQIIGAAKGTITDHIDGDGLDNRKSNLRLCTLIQNARNKSGQAGTSCEYKGVCFRSKKNTFSVSIKINDKNTHLGYFKNKEDAARAYDKKAKEAFGEYARLNFPEEYK